MDDIIAVLRAYKELVVLTTATLLLILLLRTWWDEISLFVKSSWYAFPIIGRGSRLARKTGRNTNGWFQSEVELCADFYQHYKKLRYNEDDFKKAQSYLAKVNEIGRSPLSTGGWIVISTLVFLEAMGFSYVLAGWTVPGASEATQMAGAFGISVVVSIILVMMTHFTGHELYIRNVVRSVRNQWLAHRHDEKNISPRALIIDNDYLDDGEPNYVQTSNRLSVSSDLRVRFPILTVLTVFMVIAVAAGATYVRQQKLEQVLIEETTLHSSAPTTSWPTLNQAPSILSGPQRAAEDKAESEMTDTKRRGGLVTFAVLAVLFVFIQIVGTLMGYRTGFAGRQSRPAWQMTHRYATVSEYVEYHRSLLATVANLAQSHLSKLQTSLDERVAAATIRRDDVNSIGRTGERTFTTYILMIEQDELTRKRADDLRRQGSASTSTVAQGETSEAMEARIRRELAAEQIITSAETEAEMRERIRREMAEERVVAIRPEARGV